MRSVALLPASLIAAALALPCASAAFANIDIAIDKNTQQMSVAVDGAQRYTWPVSTGRPGYDTPNGTFKVNRMDANHFSQEWDNAPMPHTMFFDMRGHAIHGFSDVAHLGLAVSHGCVRLAPANATVLFNLVKAEGMANTSVTITGRTPNGDTGPVARAAPAGQRNRLFAAAAPGYDRAAAWLWPAAAWLWPAAGLQPAATARLRPAAAARLQPAAAGLRPATAAPAAACRLRPAAVLRPARLRPGLLRPALLWAAAAAVLRPAAVLRTAAALLRALDHAVLSRPGTDVVFPPLKME